MSIKVILKQKGLTKQKITTSMIASLLDLSYGIKDKYYCLDEDKIDNKTLLYNRNKLARGIEVEIDNYDVLLTLYLPSTHSEIDLFYRLIERCCEYLQKRYFIKNDILYSIDDIHKCIEEDTLLSKSVLCSIKEQLLNHKIDSYLLLGIMYPICITSKEMNEIKGDLYRLEEYLDRLQSIDYAYAKPNIYKRKDNSLFGGYFLGEDIDTILPINPNLFIEEKIQDWFIIFPEKKIMPYDFFISNVNYSYFDGNHGVVCCSRSDINELFDKKYDTLDIY